MKFVPLDRSTGHAVISHDGFQPFPGASAAIPRTYLGSNNGRPATGAGRHVS